MSAKAQKLFEDAMQANLVGDTSRATDLLKQVVEDDPERVDAWVELSKLLTDYDERRMALTTVLNLDPNNTYAQQELESVEKPKPPVDNGEVVPGISRKQARTVGIGLAAYTAFVCGATFLIVMLINNNKAAQAAQVALLQSNQAETQTALTAIVLNETATVLEAANLAATGTEIARATQLIETTSTPTVTPTRAFALPPENTPTPIPTEVSYRVLDLPPALSGHVLTWGGKDVRSDDYLPMFSFDVSAPGSTGQRITNELGRNPLMSSDNSFTVFEQWRSDGTRLYMSILDPVTPGGTLDTLVSSRFLITTLRDPSLSTDMKRIAFVATDYNTKIESAYLADVSNLASVKFYQLGQDGASYTGITLSPDGTKAVAVRNDGTTTDLVVFDLTSLVETSVAATPPPPPLNTPVDNAPTLVPPPTSAPAGIPIRPLTTDGNSLVEANPAFSPDGATVVYDAFSTSTPNNRDLYTVDVGASTSAATPIMTLDGNDISPTFSPDGNFIAFASDRTTGIYNVFIYDRTTRTTYQLTEDANGFYPGSWGS